MITKAYLTHNNYLDYQLNAHKNISFISQLYYKILFVLAKLYLIQQ
jgi:hypothetical protein